MTTLTPPVGTAIRQARVRQAGPMVSLRLLVAALAGLLVFGNILLLVFLGQPLVLGIALATLLPAGFAMLAYRSISGTVRVPAWTVALCFTVAALLLILGGEGRLFYATADWQIRDAVLADMATHAWPFDYWLDGRSQMLRAPLGMYLLPALLGGNSQAARDWALFAQNMVVLGLILSMACALFETGRTRIIALVVFVAFSGLDVIGTLLVSALTGHAGWDHLERWAGSLQYSSHITQIFWVPQHAFAGWTCALAYLFWRRGLLPIGLFGAMIPLVALWSPFALFGSLPFALFAGLRVLITGKWGWRDVFLCGLSLAIALPALLYMNADARSVGGSIVLPPPILYLLVMAVEVAPFMLPLLRAHPIDADRPTLWIVLGCLLLMPFWQIGLNSDFQMRASIVPLAIAALSFAGWAAGLTALRAKIGFLLVIGLGSVTGAVEIERVFRLLPAPPPLCSLQKSWMQQTGMIVPHSTYFAPHDALPRWLAPARPIDRAGTDDPVQCWSRDWSTLKGGGKA